MKKILFYVCLSISVISCGNGGQQGTPVKPQEKQLNISILLDLSDRISPQINPATPEHYQRDIENIKTVTEFFKANMVHLTAWKAKGKIRIFFSPAPSTPIVNEIASKLNIDCSTMDNKGRKKVHDTISGLFAQNLAEIYKQTIATSTWEGSDIWRFFKDDVKSYCVAKDTTYRNILIIFTDGYLYHKQSFIRNNNRFSYLLESNIRQYRRMNWQELIDGDDFGIISEVKDLNNVEVLVLEICAEKSSNKIDEDILKYTWQKWLEEMNVSHYEVYSSDLPTNTKTRIEVFLNK
jgi:hypothetical protein